MDNKKVGHFWGHSVVLNYDCRPCCIKALCADVPLRNYSFTYTFIECIHRMLHIYAATKPMDFESKPVTTDGMKCDIGLDMDGDGFKSHKPGAPGKENSQVYLLHYLSYYIY